MQRTNIVITEPSAEVSAALAQRGRLAAMLGSTLVLCGVFGAALSVVSSGRVQLVPILLLAAGITLVLYGQVMAKAGATGELGDLDV